MLLEDFGLYREGKLAKAAVLLFGKKPQSLNSSAVVRCARFKGRDTHKGAVDDQQIEGTLLVQVLESEKFVVRNIRHGWRMKDFNRVEEPEYPLTAIREALRNAIVHRDYSAPADTQVRIFDDRIEILNPGHLVKGLTVERIRRDHLSFRRNRLIDDAFYRARLIEKFGTGIGRMVDALTTAGLPEPEFEDDGISFTVRMWGPEQDSFTVTPSPGQPVLGPPTPDLVHPYPLQPHFTGRIAERKWLTEWFTTDSRPVCVVEAIGGMGKSALAWFWLHADVLGTPPAGYSKADQENLRVPEDRRPEGVLFWSFYERDAHFGAFLDRAARYVGAGDDSAGGLSDREKLDGLLRALEQRRILLILDGFERELRDYAGYRAPYQGDEARGEDGNDCVDPRAAEFLQSGASFALAGRVLLTSRLFPNELTDLAGCRHARLENLAPDDVVSFFEATGVKGTRAEIAQAVAPYGGHPLSVSLLARAIVKDRRMRGDITAAGRHTVLDKLKGRQGHDILAVAYNEMPAEHRQLLSRIAAFRSPMDYEALETVATQKGAKPDAALDELEARGLLLRDPDTERYELHPIVRQYAYDRLADKAGVHGRLREYFEARPVPERVETLADLTPTIELYWHTVGAGRFDAARELYRDRLSEPLYYRFGTYERIIELLGAVFPVGEDRPPRLTSESAQAWTLNTLANSYSLSGQPRRAVPLFETHNALRKKLDEKKNLSVGLRNLADDQLKLGELEAAERALRRSIELCREIEDEFSEAVGHQELGRLRAYEGRFSETERELEVSTKHWREIGDQQGVCLDWTYRARLDLLRGDPKAALAAAHESRLLAEARSVERDIIQAEWLLGWAHTALGETAAAEPHLNEALTRCRRINLIELEPSILLAWARLHQDRQIALKALAIADRCEYRLDQADIHNFLARLALDSGKPAEARDQAQKAKDYAYCDGPPHYYKPAYEEAERLLAEAAGV